MIKCHVVDGLLRPCETLDKAIEWETRGKGLRFLQLTNLTTLQPSRSCATVHSGEWKKQGVILNFCPFCGTAISEHMGA